MLTCAVGIFSYVVLVKFPDEEIKNPSTRFLKPEQTKIVLQRLDADRGDTELEPFSLKAFLKPAKDIEIWGFAFLFL